MIRDHFKFLKGVLMATALLLLSSCNGKVDQDLIDSILGVCLRMPSGRS
ncbi:MAG: hypothetical protein J6T35_09035 [Bacteroidales bacterium]|nr:hypothetical protein [Bacteroidales bacterium]